MVEGAEEVAVCADGDPSLGRATDNNPTTLRLGDDARTLACRTERTPHRSVG